MREILGKAKTVRELLDGRKYSIDYYQREYKWGTKQVQELLDDLSDRFLQDYTDGDERKAVERYGHYFLGSVIMSRKDTVDYIVDGQQRLTTLTLLLIFLYHLQRGRQDEVKIEELIYSERFGSKSFNLDVPERNRVMEVLFHEEDFDETDEPESVVTIIDRYRDLEALFPEEISGSALPFFIDWLIENVHLVEITAYSDDDAYTIFETMNDRGLSLAPTDMLKGFLLANITDEDRRTHASNLWKDRLARLADLGKEQDADFIRSWLRGQHAKSQRERTKGASPGDFDRLGPEFHRWVREHRIELGLEKSEDYFRFIERDFAFFSRQYEILRRASQRLEHGFETVFYNAQFQFTLQYPVMLASLTPDDNDRIIEEKIRLVGTYLDILIARRLWNFKSIAYSTMQYAMFLVMLDVRGKDPLQLSKALQNRLASDEQEISFRTKDEFYVHQQNRKFVHQLLARMTDFIETQSEMPSRYVEYISGRGNDKYEVEHIWANKFERHKDEFGHEADFQTYRNRIGGLLLLPKSFNGSYGALPYEEKRSHYDSQNLLARSLHENAYEHNPGFTRFIRDSGLPFRAHAEFKIKDLAERQELVRLIAELVWNPQRLELSESVSAAL